MKLFADDSSLFVKGNDVDTTQRILEDDLKTIASWEHQWKMKFNPDVTKAAIEVIFSRKKNKYCRGRIFLLHTFKSNKKSLNLTQRT